MRKLLTFITLLLAATACSKDKTEPSIDFGPNGGFTPRYSNAMSAGPEDPTDWTSDASWNEKEQKLFVGLNLSLTGPQLPATTWSFDFFPNPGQLSGDHEFDIFARYGAALPTGAMRLSTAIVDSQYGLIISDDFEIRSSQLRMRFALDPAKFTANKLYRLYYVVYEPGKQVYYRGHGDIKIR